MNCKKNANNTDNTRNANNANNAEIPEAIKTLTKCVLQKWHIGAFRKETKGIVAGVKVLLRWD